MDRKDKFKDCIKQISDKLSQGSDFSDSNSIKDFQNTATSLGSQIDGIFEEGRLLRIGIVGEVKSGKSSFMNALIFDGKEVLPKAATPMTAALTVVSFDEKQKAKVYFYDVNGWKNIVNSARFAEAEIDKKVEDQLTKSKKSILKPGKFSQPLDKDKLRKSFESQLNPVQQACLELTRMAERNNLNADNFLDKEEEIPFDPGSDLSNTLHEYVGSSGKYTPLVQQTELIINNPMLKDIQIVDTPGLNDPVISRTLKTKDYLKSCDVIFLVCYSAGPLLGSEEINLIENIFPKESVQKIIIIGSKFDSQILQYQESNVNFQKAYAISRKKCEDKVTDNVAKLKAKPNHSAIIDDLNDSKFYLISSLMYSVAKKKEDNISLSDEERIILDQFKQRFIGFNDEINFLYDFSAINRVKSSLEDIRKNKDQIIEEKTKDFINVQKHNLSQILGNIKKSALQYSDYIKTDDIDTINDKVKETEMILDTISDKVYLLFQDTSISAKKIIQSLQNTLHYKISDFKDISSESYTTTHNYTTGWIFKDKHTEITTHHKSKVEDAVLNIGNYITTCNEIVQKNFNSLIDIESLKRSINDLILVACDTRSSDFDPEQISIPVESALKEISVSRISINIQQYREKIYNEFSRPIVEDQEIHKLESSLIKNLNLIYDDIKKLLDKEQTKIEANIKDQSFTFINKIKKYITERRDKLTILLNDKKGNLEKIKNFINLIDDFHSQLGEI
jgi:hypothetical protein